MARPLESRAPALPPPIEIGTDRSLSPSHHAQTPPPPPHAPPANTLWRSTAGRSTCPANISPHTSPAIPTQEMQNRGTTLRAHRRFEPTPPHSHGPFSKSPRDPRTAGPNRRT